MQRLSRMKTITRNDSALLSSRLVLMIIIGAMAFIMAVQLSTGL